MKKLKIDDKGLGWTIDFDQICELAEEVRVAEQVSLEQVEAVVLALVKYGYLKLGEGEENL